MVIKTVIYCESEYQQFVTVCILVWFMRRGNFILRVIYAVPGIPTHQQQQRQITLLRWVILWEIATS